MGSNDAGVQLDADSETSAALCDHRSPPAPRPGVVDAGGSLDLVFASYEIDFGLGLDDAGTPRINSLGYDLDHTCTGWGQGASCVEPPWATHYKDGVDGIDNGLVAAGFRPAGDSTIPYPYGQDGQDPLLRIRGYNGGTDDDRVEVSFYVGVNVEGRSGPVWDGQDAWTIHSGVLLPPQDGGANYDVDRPRFVDDHAYVSGGTVVARLPYLQWGVPPLPSFYQALVTAKITKASGGWVLEQAIFAGRVRVADGLIQLGSWTNGDDAGGIVCQNKADYDALKAQVCSFVDIALGPDNPSAPCDAFAYAAGFTARQARLGPPVFVLPDGPLPCASDVHPETDTCAPDP